MPESGAAPERPPAAGVTLDTLIAPTARADFLKAYWEQAVLVVARNEPQYYQGLLSLDDIDHVITALNPRHPDVELVDAKQTIRPADYTLGRGRIDVARLYAFFADGATVILPQLHRRLPRLAMLCRTMERAFSMPFQTNIYLTPADAQGFKSHFDTHDVFVLQVAGRKTWTFYDTPIRLPHRGQRFDSAIHDVGEPQWSVEITAGSLLYIPRGVMHDATAHDEISLHITLGALAYTWTDLLLEAVSQVSLEDEAFRRALPAGFANPGAAEGALAQTFRELLDRFVARARVDEAAAQFAHRLRATREPLLEGQIHQIAALAGLTLDSRLKPRPALIFDLAERESRAILRCYGKEISLPGHAFAALGHALAAPSFTPRALPGDLDEEGRLALTRRLVREGLVTFV